MDKIMTYSVNTTEKSTTISQGWDKECKEWFESKGLKFSATRYGIAIKVYNKIIKFTESNESMEKFITTKKGHEECSINIPTVEELWQIIELQDLYEVYFYLKNECSDTLINNFKKSLKGRELLNEGSQTTARDFFFELKTATRFKKANVEIFFEKKPDILIKNKECTYHIECKRIQSLNSLKKNINKAIKQFNDSGVDKSERILSVDFSKPFFNEYPIEFNERVSDEFMKGVKKQFDDFVYEKLDEEYKYIMDEISMFFAHIRFPAILFPFQITSVNHFILKKSSSNGGDCAKSISKLLHESVGIS